MPGVNTVACPRLAYLPNPTMEGELPVPHGCSTCEKYSAFSGLSVDFVLGPVASIKKNYHKLGSLKE